MDPEQVVEGQVAEGEQQKQEAKQEPEYTSIQIKAIEQGWIPKEDFDGDESEFIDAAEFVRRGELFTKIEKQSKELKAVRQALEALSAHHSKVKEMEYERALKSLKEARRQATMDGDHERALTLEDKIDEVKAEKEQIAKEAAKPVVQDSDDTYSVEFQAWVNQNGWYETNPVLRKTADALGKDYYNQGHSPAEVLRMVERDIRKEFAHKFVDTPANKRPSAVDGSTRSGGKKDDFQMSPEERDIMRKIVAVTPGFSEADYIRDLKAIKSR